MNLLQVIQGWYNYAHGTPEVKQMMAERIAICEDCPSKEILNSLGRRIVKAIDGQGCVLRCGECSCPLAGKTAAPAQSCPLNKWGEWKPNQSYYE